MRQIQIILVAVLLSAPVAAATWGGRGQSEPDTLLDRTGGYMWSDADTTPGPALGARVYFNGFTIQNTGYVTHGVSDNENFATVQTAHGSWPGNAAAFLGVWKDCNGDGYIGLGDNALLDYRSEILTEMQTAGVAPGTTICPPVNAGTPPNGAASHSYLTVHNDGTWVYEFIAIGPDAAKDTLADGNPYDINDNGARVWADWGRPADAPMLTKCYVPAGGFGPVGTYHSTGGFLRSADCFDGYSVTDTFDTVADSQAATQPFSFSDSPHNQTNSGSQLNQPNPWGFQGSGAIVNAWNCGGTPVVVQGGNRVSAPQVPPTVDASGSAYGTVERGVDGLVDCDASTDVSGNQLSYQAANAPYSPEKTGVYDQSDAKIVSDFPMSYNEGQAIRNLVGAGPTLAGNLGQRDPLQQGTAQEQSDGLWVSDARLAEDRNPFVARGSVSNPQFVEGVEYLTTYAFLSITHAQGSTVLLQMSPGHVVGKYGQESCGGFTSGVHNGWDCASADWSCGAAYGCSGIANGASIDASVTVGQNYQFRDVDCYDNSVGPARENGVGWGVLTGTSCA